MDAAGPSHDWVEEGRVGGSGWIVGLSEMLTGLCSSPDETYLPTRMEYTWRLAPESLTVRTARLSALFCSTNAIGAQLLDDDDEIIGRLYTDCTLLGGRPVPALQPGKGEDYLELAGLRPDEVLEIISAYLS